MARAATLSTDLDRAADLLAERLGQGPAVLLLGQSLLVESGHDQLAESVAGRLGLPPQPTASLVLGGALPGNEILRLVADAGRSVVVPSGLTAICRYGWNAVFTSSIDNTLPRLLRTGWRDVHEVFESTEARSDPRNPAHLEITYLFGRCDQHEGTGRPPLSTLELLRRRPTSQDLANRLRTIVSPAGTLLISGWALGDWLSAEDLVSRVLEFAPGQVHLFGADESLIDDELVATAVASGHLTAWTLSLSELLTILDLAGRLQVGPGAHADVGERVVTLAGTPTVVPRAILGRIAAFGGLLDSEAVAQATPLSGEALYQGFREFLFSADRDPIWSAYARQLAFERDHDAELAKKLRREVQRLTDGKPIRPIVVHGQACSGKSVALQRLAFEEARRGEGLVLFLRRRHGFYPSADIDAVCTWAEENGAPYTLLVADVMESAAAQRPYADLLEELRGRRRSVFVVGSAYGDLSDQRGIVAHSCPIELTDGDRERFVALLRWVDPNLEQVVEQRRTGTPEERLLAALYRWLPATRAALRHSLKRELDYATEVIAAKPNVSDVKLSPIQREMLRVGLITPDDIVQSSDGEGEPRRNLVRELLVLVMVPAWLGLDVPIDLALRALGAAHSFEDILDAIKRTNRHAEIVRWVQEDDGSILLGARNSLEAQLLVQEVVPDEVDRARSVGALLREVRPSSARGVAGDDVGFAVQLLNVGVPAKGHAPLPRRTWGELARSLGDLRHDAGFEEPRLMLREARLHREFATSPLVALEPEEAIEHLETAREIAERGAIVARETRRPNALALNLDVEAQSASGAITIQRLKRGDRTGALAAFERQRVIMTRATLTQKGSFYPISVATWSAASVVLDDVLDEDERTTVLAELLSLYQGTTEADFESDQAIEYQKRRQQLGELLNDHQMSEAAFQRQVALGSTSAVLRRAIEMAGGVKGDYADPDAGLAVLDEHAGLAASDQHCVQLRLDLWWFRKTGGLAFEGRNRSLPLTRTDWQTCLRLIADVEAFGDSRRSGANLFRRALAHFQLDEVQRSLEVFAELRGDSSVPGSVRLSTVYHATDSRGMARHYSGRINLTGTQRRPRIYVNELASNIEVDLARFGLLQVRGPRTLEFFIGFSPQGPQAIPTVSGVTERR
jgi:hypothetical protein